MLDNNKCILVYGITDEELEGLEKANLRTLRITNEMASMKIKDILDGVRILKYNNNLPNEKVMIFNNYSDEEVRENIRLVRSVVVGGILAVVTPTSSEWTFEYLVSHLIEEREWMANQQKGR